MPVIYLRGGGGWGGLSHFEQGVQRENSSVLQ